MTQRRPGLVAGLLVAFASGLAGEEPAVLHYSPSRRVPESLAAAYAQLPPGGDAFPEEKDAAELAARLDELSAFLRAGRFTEAIEALSAPGFRGGHLAPATKEEHGTEALRVARSTAMSSDLALERAAFAEALAGFAGGLGGLRTAELLITA
ncbi:MAG TPA: hypothetical protein VFC77_03725, partial [Myxococcota bacterium]|nr:hypothetical protein [Myxococcota bacterium]